MVDDDPTEEHIDDREIELLTASMDESAFRRRAIIRAAAGPPVGEQERDGRPLPIFVAERLDRFRESLNPVLHTRHELHDALFHTVVDELDLTIGGYLKPEPKPEARDLLHVYGPDRNGTGERRYYRWGWLDHSEHVPAFSTTAPTIVRSGRLAGGCGVYGGQWAFSVGGAGMLFVPEHGAARVSVRPYMPWLALTSFNRYAVGASVVCLLGILIQSWRPGQAVVQERDHFVTVVARSSAEGYLLDNETSGTEASSTGLQTDFVAVPGRRYGIYVYAWLETNGGAAGGSGPLAYSRIELDASVPFVVAEETLL